MSLIEDFRAVIEGQNSARLDRIESRACTSDNFDGVQYNFYGDFIPIRPIISVVAEVDGYAIEKLHFTNDVEEPYVGVFVATLPRQSHPAFVNP